MAKAKTFELTERQVQVVNLVAEGFTNQEIADQMHYALETIRWHLSQIYIKLGARNRAHAVTLAIRKGVLDVREPVS